MTSLKPFFEPKSIAIIGASDKARFGLITTTYLLNAPSFKTYPVNLKKENILGHKAYKNVKDIPDEIDLAIIIISNEFVYQSVLDCAEKGIKNIIIESAGFAETGIEKYMNAQKEIISLAKKEGIRIIGPNCMGTTNFNNNFASGDLDMINNDIPPLGKISIIAQSGVAGNIFMDWASSAYIGFSKVITLGNKIDVDEVDMLEYLENDPETNVITMYLEGTKRGKDFINILKRMTKPVLILKSGKSEIGKNAVQSHTGSIAGNDRIYDAVFQQADSVFRMDDYYEMLSVGHVISTQPLPKGKNVAVITGSGSLGILTCDQIEAHGLDLANLSEETINKIKSVIPDWVSLKGTIDLGPSLLESFVTSVKAVFDDENVDAIIYIYAVPRWVLEKINLNFSPHFRLMKKLALEKQKPCITVCFGSRYVFDHVYKFSKKGRGTHPVVQKLDYAVKALKIMYEFNQYMKSK